MNTYTMIFAIMMALGISLSSGFLNKIQLKYTKYIMGSPDVSDEIKQATREMLMENYQPWLKNQYKSFIRQKCKENEQNLRKRTIPICYMWIIG